MDTLSENAVCKSWNKWTTNRNILNLILKFLALKGVKIKTTNVIFSKCETDNQVLWEFEKMDNLHPCLEYKLSRPV